MVGGEDGDEGKELEGKRKLLSNVGNRWWNGVCVKKFFTWVAHKGVFWGMRDRDFWECWWIKHMKSAGISGECTRDACFLFECWNEQKTENWSWGTIYKGNGEYFLNTTKRYNLSAKSVYLNSRTVLSLEFSMWYIPITDRGYHMLSGSWFSSKSFSSKYSRQQQSNASMISDRI